MGRSTHFSRPARFGPFHRLQSKVWNDLMSRSGLIGGRVPFGGRQPTVQAYEGSLPDDQPGIEFWTDVEPDPGGVPGQARWSLDRPGVLSREGGEVAAIPAKISKRREHASR
jgi:hypothetical protein